MKELYLVTGATGHLGNTVAHRLARAGRQVRVKDGRLEGAN